MNGKLTALEKLAVLEMRPATLKKSPDSEITESWVRLSQLYGQAKDSGHAIEDYVNAGVWVLDEMRRRGFKIDESLTFYKAVDDWTKISKRHVIRNEFAKLPNEVILVEKFINIAGSQAAQNTGKDPEDTDIIVRADPVNNGEAVALNWPLIWTAIRRHLDPDKVGGLHFVPSAQGACTDHIPLYDLVLRRKPEFVIEVIEKIEINKFMPYSDFTPPKPTMMSFTEFWDVSELWDNWAEKKLETNEGIGVEPKWKGFRGILEKKGNDVRLWFEGRPDINQLDKDVFYGIKNKALEISDDFVLDCDIGIKHGDEFIRRNDLALLNSEKPQLNSSDEIILTCFDLPYWKDDLTGKDFISRRGQLDSFYKTYLGKEKIFDLSPIKWISDEKQLQDAAKWAMDYDYSEGVVAKTESGKYALDGTTDEWAKIKRVLEIKVIVLDKKATKGGAFVYHGGIIPSSEFAYANKKKLGSTEYVDLGSTFSTGINADIGDILTVEIIELIPTQNKKTQMLELAWYGPIVQDKDDVRKEPYTVSQIVDLAKRRKILEKSKQVKKEVELGIMALGIKKQEEPQDDEGGTRSAAAARNWDKNWGQLLPQEKSRARFVYQHHWRGLEQDQTNLDENKLLDTEHSVHGDIRMDAGDHLWGLTAFLGKTEDIKKAGGDRLFNLPMDDSIQMAWKLAQPKAWLEVGVDKPLIVEPGGVAATKNKWSKFFAVDKGEYELTYAKQHFFEVFFHGDKLKGRFIFEYAPVAGDRIWIIKRPEDQTPYLDTHSLEDEIKDQQSKNRKWIWYAKEGKPVLLDLEKVKAEDFAIKDESHKFEIINKQEDKQIVIGEVLIPDKPDAHGDVITAEEIERTAHDYMIKSREIGLMHKYKAPCELIESYIAPVDIQFPNGKLVKKGTWIAGVKVNDAGLWDGIKNGTFKAFSVGGYGRRNKINKNNIAPEFFTE